VPSRSALRLSLALSAFFFLAEDLEVLEVLYGEDDIALVLRPEGVTGDLPVLPKGRREGVSSALTARVGTGGPDVDAVCDVELNLR